MDQSQIEKYTAAIRDMIADFSAAQQLEVRNRQALTVPVAHAWCMQVHRLAAASLKLIEAGFRHETLILLRTALEYAVSLHWLSQMGAEGREAVITEGFRQSKALVGELGKSSFTIPDEVLAEITKLVVGQSDELETFKRFKRLCDSMDPKGDLYLLYRYLSGTAHPSTSAAAPYINFATEPIGLLQQPIEGEAATEVTFAQLLIWAGRAFDSLVKGQPRKKYLQRQARVLGLRQVLGYVQEEDRQPAKKAPPGRAGGGSAKKQR